jgi:hypothetical protein
MVELDIWIEKVQRAEYLAEDELKALCEYVGFSQALHLNQFFPQAGNLFSIFTLFSC